MRKTWIIGVSLFDGSDALVPETCIELQDDRIASVGTAEAPRGPTDLVIDGRGLTAVPGLINLHVHLCLDITKMGDPGNPTVPLLPGTQADLVTRMLRHARETLEGGVTTVRDLGAPGDSIFLVRCLVEEGLAIGPRIVASGPMITRTGGHCWFIGDEADGVAEVRKAVRRRLKAGADVIKVMVTGGYLTPGTSPTKLGYSLREIRSAVAEARRGGVQTTVHAAGSVGIEAALVAGVDCIEHGAAMTRELAGRLVDQRVVWVPTVGVARTAKQPENRALLDRRASRRRGMVRSTRRYNEKDDDNSRLERKLEAFASLARLGGLRLGVGDDAGTLFAVHGNLVPEMEAFAEAGFTNAEILRLATSGNAEILRLEHLIGCIRPGLLGDVLLVHGDPLADLRSLRKVAIVLKDGRVQFVRGEDEIRLRGGSRSDA